MIMATKPSVLLGSGFIGAMPQQRIVVNKTIKPVSEKKVKKPIKACKR